MIKFSIIVPVYNVEKYIDRCLNSIKKQSYENFEVIVVNDGTKDNSQTIIDKYVKEDKRFKSYIKENGGLSDARNYGLKYVKGDYILFVDSDDYINQDLLLSLSNECEKNKDIDIIKYQVTTVNENGETIKKIIGSEFDNATPKDILIKLIADEMFEPAWLYAFKTSFWQKNKFLFAKGRLHEDFGLIPYVIIKAKRISATSYYGYNYVIRSNSIITSKSRENDLKKMNDILYHFDNLMNLIGKEKTDEQTKKIFKSFLANEIILKAKHLKGSDFNNYIKELKNRNVSKLLLDDTLPRKLKKAVIALNTKLYVKRIAK